MAYDFVNEPDVRAAAQTLVMRMLNFLTAHAWTVVMPDGTISTTFVIRPDENMIDRALNGPNSTRDAQTLTYLNQFLERPRRDAQVNLEGQFASCVSADESCNPISIPQRVTTDFLWQRSPFQLVGGGSGSIEGAGIDYLLPFWMASYYRVFNEAKPVRVQR